MTPEVSPRPSPLFLFLSAYTASSPSLHCLFPLLTLPLPPPYTASSPPYTASPPPYTASPPPYTASSPSLHCLFPPYTTSSPSLHCSSPSLHCLFPLLTLPLPPPYTGLFPSPYLPLPPPYTASSPYLCRFAVHAHFSLLLTFLRGQLF